MDSPAAKAAAEQGISLNKIPLPVIETYEPDQLVAAAAAYTAAVLKVRAAEQAIAKIKVEQIEREKRIALLQATLTAIPDDPIDVWCCTRTYNLAVGATVKTIDVPGYRVDDPPAVKTFILHNNTTRARTVVYEERSFNIAPEGYGFPNHGKLTPSESMSDAAIAYNLAMEPGNLKWKPLWRYGVLLTDYSTHSVSNHGTVRLTLRNARGQDNLPIDDDDDEVITNVPISYPPCNGRAFSMNDEVLVLFEGQNRDQPKIIGFRREPKACPDSWIEIF